MTRLLAAGLLAVLCACGATAPRSDTPTRLIVRWETGQGSIAARLAEVERVLGARVRHEREMSGGAHVLSVLDDVEPETLDAALQRLAALPHVRYAVREARRVAH